MNNNATKSRVCAVTLKFGEEFRDRPAPLAGIVDLLDELASEIVESLAASVFGLKFADSYLTRAE